MHAIIKRSQRKSEVLKELGGVALHAEELEKELNKWKLQAAAIQSKFDSAGVEYRNRIQDITTQKDDVVEKNKTLHREKKGNPQ